MPYQVSYLADIEHKFDFMNVSYNGNSQAPIDYWPLELGNLENIKSIEQGCLVRWLNKATSRLGAIVAFPLTLLDLTITGIAVTIMHRMYLIRGDDSTRHCVSLLSNRMYGNLAVLGLIAILILAGSTAPNRKKIWIGPSPVLI